MADSSFDVVSKYDHREIDNAVNQAAKKASQYYDFKGVGISITFSGKMTTIAANSLERVLAIYGIPQTKFICRGVSLKSLDVGNGELKQPDKEYRLIGTLKRGLGQESMKKPSELVRDEGPKGIEVQTQGEELHISSRPRNILREATSLLKGANVDYTLQFQNCCWRPPGPSKAGRPITDKFQNWNGRSKMKRGNSRRGRDGPCNPMEPTRTSV